MNKNAVETKLHVPRHDRVPAVGAALGFGGFAIAAAGFGFAASPLLAVIGTLMAVASFPTVYFSKTQRDRRAAGIAGGFQPSRRWDLNGVNPTTGLPMAGGVDTAGNAFGTGQRRIY